MVYFYIIMRIFKLKGTLRPEQAGKTQRSLHIPVQADHSLSSCYAQFMNPEQFMKYHAKTKQFVHSKISYLNVA